MEAKSAGELKSELIDPYFSYHVFVKNIWYVLSSLPIIKMDITIEGIPLLIVDIVLQMLSWE